MIDCQKHLFSLPEDIAYLNCSYQAPLLKSAEAAGISGLHQKQNPANIKREDFFDPPQQVRELFAELINCPDPDRIALLPSVSYGLAQVVANIQVGANQKVLLVDEQFPSNYYPWKRLADETGAQLRIVTPPDFENRGSSWNEAILDAITGDVAVVAMGNVHWADGTRFDLERIGQKARTVGAKLIIDGTQSIGALPFDLQKVGADAVICAAYKWLLGPYSTALGYFSESFDNGRPIEENWINRLDSDRFENLVNYESLYRPKAQRFNVGEYSNFIYIPMLAASLKQILEWTPERIQDYGETIYSPFHSELLELGCTVENPLWRGNHLFGVRFPDNVDPNVLREKLAEQNVFVSIRGNSLRVALHLWNEPRHLKMLVAALRKAVVVVV
jgi:selenocysteine lyase/cysteine desulfurase